jgi:putative FmdB family regulatory protein
MPTYAYRCADCGHEFDAFQRFSDDPLRECPSCGGVVRRVIQPVGVVFKGSGWYITDSRAKPDEAKPKEAKAVDGADKAAATEKTDASSGEKPATDKTPAAATKTAEPATAGAGAKVAAKAAAD